MYLWTHLDSPKNEGGWPSRRSSGRGKHPPSVRAFHEARLLGDKRAALPASPRPSRRSHFEPDPARRFEPLVVGRVAPPSIATLPTRRGSMRSPVSSNWPPFVHGVALFESDFVGPRSGLSHVAQEPLQSGFQCHLCGRSARPAEPCVKNVPGQPVLSAGLSRFHDEFVQPLRVVAHVLAASKALDR